MSQLNINTLAAQSGSVIHLSSHVSGSSASSGSFGYLNVFGDTVIGGNMTFGDADTDSISIAADLTSNLIPNADATYDLGSSGKQWKDIYINGIGYMDQLGTDADPVALYVNAGEVDGVVIGGESAAAGTFTAIVGTSLTGGTGAKLGRMESKVR